MRKKMKVSLPLLVTTLLVSCGGIAQSIPKLEIVDNLYETYSTVEVMPIEPREGHALIYAYRSCEGVPNELVVLKKGDKEPLTQGSLGLSVDYRPDDYSSRVIQLDVPLKATDHVCVIEYFYGKDDKKSANVLSYVVSAGKDVIPISTGSSVPRVQSENSKRTYARLITGIDVSAAASADPAANFMADLSFDVPFSNRKPSLYNQNSASGYIRLASIAQPGEINGIANPATYIKPLTDSTPATLVQSWEGNVSFAHKISYNVNLGEQNSYWTISLVGNGGFVSPLSVSQAKPTVYVANQAIYNYYTATPTPSAAAAKAIFDACTVPASGTFPTCYLAYIPQDRSRFFRNYAAGVTFKRYHYLGKDTADDRFDFPGSATLTIGQNEYVTKGQLRGLVLHGDMFWPIPGILKNNWQGSMYFFGSVDTHLSRNESAQQFLLQTAGSTITLTSPQVAIIPVQQPDRDRYRFGIGVDLTTLIHAISSALPAKDPTPKGTVPPASPDSVPKKSADAKPTGGTP